MQLHIVFYLSVTRRQQAPELRARGGGELSLAEEGGGELAVSLALDASGDAGFDAAAYMGALQARRFGRWMLWSPRMASTHDLVTQNFAKLPVGVVCATDVQFKGRVDVTEDLKLLHALWGRSKNVWESPPGCLMFSFTSQMNDARKLPLMQYVVCLAMTEAIKDLCCAKGLPELDVRIKWPNDLYLKGLKVGGILCTSSYEPKVYNICTGIGLNVDNEKPTTCLNAALQELKANSPRLKREDILASFFNKFEVLFDIFSNQGFQALEEQYYNSWLHSGQRVVVQDAHEGQSVNSVVTIKGLTPSGYLYAVGEDGKSYELHPDGNRIGEEKDRCIRLPVQIQCHRRDLAGHEENMSPGLETEARDLAEPELAWTNKSGANHVKEPQEKGSVSEDSPRLFCN
uniref:Biotin--protein ligase n=1 Tax=Aegilops tauschii TaxID=37682 RepID=M8B9E8_AEGTA